jgi:hypothetical protein
MQRTNKAHSRVRSPLRSLILSSLFYPPNCGCLALCGQVRRMLDEWKQKVSQGYQQSAEELKKVKEVAPHTVLCCAVLSCAVCPLCAVLRVLSCSVKLLRVLYCVQCGVIYCVRCAVFSVAYRVRCAALLRVLCFSVLCRLPCAVCRVSCAVCHVSCDVCLVLCAVCCAGYG